MSEDEEEGIPGIISLAQKLDTGQVGPDDTEGQEQHGSRALLSAANQFAAHGSWSHEDGDRFEWCILFGGTESKVERLLELEPMENPYEVLRKNFEDTGMLECALQMSICKTLIALLVTYKRRSAYKGVTGVKADLSMVGGRDSRDVKMSRQACAKHGAQIWEKFQGERPLLDMAEYLGQQTPPKFMKRLV